jgi:hypothetical protein
MTNEKIPYSSRRRSLYLSTLEALPIFDQIVHRLVLGQSANTVAKWCYEQKIDTAGLWTWRKRIEALAAKVKDQIKDLKTDPLIKSARQTLEKSLPGLKFEPKFDIEIAKQLHVRFHQTLDREIASITSEVVLKRAIAMMQVRLDIQMGMETKVGVVVPGGHLNFMVLGQLCEALRKHELGVSYRDQKDGSNPRGSYPESQQAPINLLEGFDTIDRNLLREARLKVLEIMADVVSVGQSRYGEVGDDTKDDCADSLGSARAV